MKTHFLSQFFSSITIPPVTPESLAAYYAAAPDGELHRLVPAELTSVARALLKAEIERRAQSRRKPDRVA